MRAIYVWMGVFTGLLTVGVAWQEAGRDDQLIEPILRSSNAARDGRVPTKLPLQKSLISVQTLEVVPVARPHFSPALRDIFALPRPTVISPPPVPALAAPPPPEPAPEPNVRFLGRFMDPQGIDSVYLLQGDQELEAKPGDALPNGYVVESLSQEALFLVYPRLGVRVTVPLGNEEP